MCENFDFSSAIILNIYYFVINHPLMWLKIRCRISDGLTDSCWTSLPLAVKYCWGSENLFGDALLFNKQNQTKINTTFWRFNHFQNHLHVWKNNDIINVSNLTKEERKITQLTSLIFCLCFSGLVSPSPNMTSSTCSTQSTNNLVFDLITDINSTKLIRNETFSFTASLTPCHRRSRADSCCWISQGCVEEMRLEIWEACVLMCSCFSR